MAKKHIWVIYRLYISPEDWDIKRRISFSLASLPTGEKKTDCFLEICVLSVCGRECVLRSNPCEKHLMKEKFKGGNVFSIYFSKALCFLGKTELDVDSFSYTQNLPILVTTLLLTVLVEKLNFCEVLSLYEERTGTSSSPREVVP